MKHVDSLWTLDELTAEVAKALAEGYEGAASGRVRAVPDRRTIRYYTTLGLIERPSEMRGRTALYGRRHLYQIVAIKKLQALGRSLAEIQRELTGQTDRYLARFAAGDVRPAEGASDAARSPQQTPGFWRREPAAHTPAVPAADDGSVALVPSAGNPDDHRPRALVGVPLIAGATLLLTPSRPIEDEDLAAIRQAARSLIDTLTRSHLIDPREQGDVP